MYQEGVPEIVIDQEMYYPTDTNYGYYCTGFESPVDWEDPQNILVADGPEVQYVGTQTEPLPYVYYTPSYGHSPSPYNPYNPYIPGAVVGDSPFLGAQQYYAIPPYQSPASPTAYVPVFIQPDGIPNSSTDSLLDTRASVDTRPDGRGAKYNLATASAALSRKSAPNQADSLSRVTDGQSKHYAVQRSIPDSSGSASARAHRARVASGSIQPIGIIPGGKPPSYRDQLKTDLPVGNAISDYGVNACGRGDLDKLRPKIHVGRVFNDANGFPDKWAEQNRGPRTNRSKNQLVVKAYTSEAGNCDAEGSIIIYTDQYNKDDFPVDYADAKFFVIKSYSEDDVHKSIKYNVWSSTPHGNKKLENVFEDAQKIAAGRHNSCPVFLFFSVNASGQFCGVAEMIGSVDFQKDMDCWQQDKWSGSFPVKWHIIKDVPNGQFRHIILGNNENKPVTNSRDTQEIMYVQGTEMLKIFKNHVMKTSLLDDFLYYENRQRIMQEERAMQLIKSLESPVLPPASAFNPANKLNHVKLLLNENERSIKQRDPELSRTIVPSSSQQVPSTNSRSTNGSLERIAAEAEDDASNLMISSLSINSNQDESKFSASAATKTDAVEVVNFGSVTVKVNRFTESPGFLTVGTIPLNPKTLQLDEGCISAKKGT
ncbi:YTH domain-containing family protein 1 [Hibiscus syriacus]|uniref:YTH domain-containing family protein n=1 Tax=Hibiscus syriacus TaxID=106335 RepID=A0A6A2YWG5_HIBSY|nr:YTH domain-containing protein ECT4-like [Hibiscus syriacus]KAE8683375.1 YTH domain-containing family protein 1 [Hibiscus syriacus]